MSDQVLEQVLPDGVAEGSVEAQGLLEWLFHSMGDGRVKLDGAPSIGAFSWLQHLRSNAKAAEAFYNKYLDHTMKRAMADAKDGEGGGVAEDVLVDEAGIERMVELCQGSKK